MIAITIIMHIELEILVSVTGQEKLNAKWNYWERRGGFVSICKPYNRLSGKFRLSNEKALELIREFKFDNYKMKDFKTIVLKCTEINNNLGVME